MRCFPSSALFPCRSHEAGPGYQLPSLLLVPSSSSRELETYQKSKGTHTEEQCPEDGQTNVHDEILIVPAHVVDQEDGQTDEQDRILNLVPAVAVDREVRQYVLAGGRNLSKTVGPAHRWLHAAAIGSLLTHVVFYFLVTTTGECSTQNVIYAWWVWVPVVLFGAFRLLIEWNCVCHTALPFVAIGGQFKILGRHTTFWPWLLFSATCSAFALADMCFDSGFTAITQRALSCDASLEDAWSVQWSQSFLGHLSIPPPSLNLYVLGSWLLLLAQVLWPIILEVYFLMSQHSTIEYKVGHNVKWSTTISLAEASGLASMQQLALAYPEAQRQFNPHPWTDLNYLVSLADLIGTRIALSFIAENCVQLDLQATLFGLNRRSLDRQEISPATAQATASIVLSIIMTALKFADINSFLDLAAKAQSRVKDRGWLHGSDFVEGVMRRDLSEINSAHRWNHDVDDMLKLSKTRWSKLKQAKWMARGGATVMVISLVSTFIHLVAANVCEGSAFNFYNGCVVFPKNSV